jgi:hypothetical protein
MWASARGRMTSRAGRPARMPRSTTTATPLRHYSPSRWRENRNDLRRLVLLSRHASSPGRRRPHWLRCPVGCVSSFSCEVGVGEKVKLVIQPITLRMDEGRRLHLHIRDLSFSCGDPSPGPAYDVVFQGFSTSPFHDALRDSLRAGYLDFNPLSAYSYEPSNQLVRIRVQREMVTPDSDDSVAPEPSLRKGMSSALALPLSHRGTDPSMNIRS